MENLSKETLITIVNDLNEKLNQRDSQLERADLRLVNDHEKLQSKYNHLKQINEKLENELNDMKQVSQRQPIVSEREHSKEVDNFNMTTQQRCNVLNFIQKFCTWRKDPVPIEDPSGSSFTTIAPESSTLLHQNLRAWAMQQGILTKGKCRAIPDKNSFVRFMNAEQIRRYPEEKFKPQEKWEFPYPYWGTHSSPRYNLKLNKTFTSSQ